MTQVTLFADFGRSRLRCCLGQTFEGVGLTKQKAKTAAAERALSRAFVQFRNVEPISRILLRTRRDVINPHDDVIDFSSDHEPRLPTAAGDVRRMFADSATVSSPALSSTTSSSSSSLATSSSASSSASAAAAENDVSHGTVMTSSG